jgi:hypothetical protein
MSYTPEKAREFLDAMAEGHPLAKEENWRLALDNNLGNHTMRALMIIAMGGEERNLGDVTLTLRSGAPSIEDLC